MAAGESLDPDKLLGHIRRGIEEWEQAPAFSREEQEASERVTGCFATLDDWLSRGGRRPSSWPSADWLATRGRVERLVWGVGQSQIEELAGRAVTDTEMERIARGIEYSTAMEAVAAAVEQVCGLPPDDDAEGSTA